MYFHIIASGSKGNATLIISNKTKILIDMGISFVRLKEGLSEINVSPEEIDGAIFTHNHTDHVSGLKFLSPKICYSLEGTLPSLSNTVNLFEPFFVKEVKITPVKTSHDAKNPCGFILEDDSEKLSYITDTGVIPEESLPYLNNPNYLLIESNHDIAMLMNTNRPELLKERIMSEYGHLCNEQSAYYTCGLIGKRTKEIILMHISEEANTPEQALKAYKEILNEKGIDCSDLQIRVANQWKSLTGGSYEG